MGTYHINLYPASFLVLLSSTTQLTHSTTFRLTPLYTISASMVPLSTLNASSKTSEAVAVPANQLQYDRTVNCTSANWQLKYAVTTLTGMKRKVSLARSSVTRVRRSTDRDSLMAIRLKFCGRQRIERTRQTT